MDAFRRFADREEAAAALAGRLQEYRGRNPLIVAIPRGAVPMGKILADELNGELDIVLVHKLGAPYDPEFAIGAIDESGNVFLTEDSDQRDGGYNLIDEVKARQLATLRARRERYSPHLHPVDPRGRIVIVVDDGLATGSTMMAALLAMRAREPQELICAVPVAAPDSLRRVAPFADKTICLQSPAGFGAVSQFYRHFPQVEDDDVVRMLAENARARAATNRGMRT